MYGLNFLESVKSSGYLDVNAAASSGWAFTYQCILHPLNFAQASRVARGERGSSFRALRGQGLRLFGFSLGIVGRHGCACTVQTIARFFAHVSCQCAEFDADLPRRSSFFFGRFCATHVALKKRIIKNASVVKVQPTFIAILSWVTTTGSLTF